MLDLYFVEEAAAGIMFDDGHTVRDFIRDLFIFLMKDFSPGCPLVKGALRC